MGCAGVHRFKNLPVTIGHNDRCGTGFGDGGVLIREYGSKWQIHSTRVRNPAGYNRDQPRVPDVELGCDGRQAAEVFRAAGTLGKV